MDLPKSIELLLHRLFSDTHLPQNLKKMGFKGEIFWGVRTKNSLGDVFIGQNNDFKRG